MPDARLLHLPADAARLLASGQLVAFPTETVYGLGARMDDAQAVARIFEAKGRPASNPLIAHVASVTTARSLAAEWTPSAEALAHLWPGPLTLVVRRAIGVPDHATAGLDTLGIRVPSHPLASEMLGACPFPVVAPSANRSGRPSPTTAQAVLDDLSGRIDAVLDGLQSQTGLESTVVDVSRGEAVILRPGSVTLGDLRAVWPGARMARPDDSAERSPGTRFRHYAPDARVHIDALGEAPRWWIGIGSPDDPAAFAVVRSLPGADAYARALFAFFREADAEGAASITCAPVQADGIGVALMDRIERAARG